MRIEITLEVDDRLIADRAAAANADHPDEPLTMREYAIQRVQAVLDDELNLALWGWDFASEVRVPLEGPTPLLIAAWVLGYMTDGNPSLPDWPFDTSDTQQARQAWELAKGMVRDGIPA